MTRVMLRELRRATGLTQEQLAERTGLTVRAISNIERSRVARPHRHSLEALADALGLTGDRLDDFVRAYLPGPKDLHTAPAQLPARTATFTGRERELAELDRLLARRGEEVVVVCVDGMAGVGKTALAVHWAHEVRHLFPGGHLFANLRGYGPGDPVEPGGVLGSFLRALGMPPGEIPVGTDERSASLRSLLATRPALIVLDNAASAEQVRPLLPGTPHSLTLVTSRVALHGLAVSDEAHRIAPARFTEQESVDLLTTLLGAADQQVLAELAGYCAGLPLALRIVAERSSGGRSPVETAAALADQHHRLDVLTTGDEATSVGAVLSWSYRSLPDDAATAFRRLGVHPGAHWDVDAAAVLVDADRVRTARLLDTLVDRHLLERRTDGRFEFHDLLRAYAVTLADDERAFGRLAAYYVGRAAGLFAVRDPHRRPLLGGGATATRPEDDAEDAASWLTTELPTLLAIAEHAEDLAGTTIARDLSATLWYVLRVQGHYDAASTLHALALAEARRDDDRDGTRQALIDLGTTFGRLGSYDHAVRALEECLAIPGEPLVSGRALNALGIVSAQIGRFEDAVRQLDEAVELARRTGDGLTESRALSNLGYVHDRLGRFDQARDSYQQCLTIAEAAGDRPSAAIALHNLGDVCRALGRYDEALENLHRSLAISRPAGHREAEGYALTFLGSVHGERGDHAEATREHGAALAIALDTGIRPLQMLAHNGLGDSALAAGDRNSALAHYTDALALARRTHEENEERRALAGIAAARPEDGRTP